MTGPTTPIPHRGRRLLLWLVITLALGGLALRTRFSSDLQPLLPSSDPTLSRHLSFFAGRGVGQVMALEAWADDPAHGEDAKQALRQLVERLGPLGATPFALGDPAAVARLAAAVYRFLPLLLTADDLAGVAASCTPAALRARLAALKQRVHERPEDQFVAGAARDDLLALAGVVFAATRSHLADGSQDHGLVVHQDGAHSLVALHVGFAPNDMDPTYKLMEVFDAAQQAAAANGLHLEAIGSYRHFRDNISGINQDLLATGPVSIVAMIILLYSLVRSVRALIALHLPALLALIGSLAAIAVFWHEVPLVMLGFVACFIGVSVENALHMTLALQAGEEGHVRWPLIESFLTTAVAFAVLLFSSVPALRCLGLTVLGGLLAALVASLWLLPLLVARRAGEPWAAATTWLMRISTGRFAPRLVIALALSAALLPGLMRLHFIDDLKRMDGSRPETLAAEAAFFARWDKIESSDFLVAGAGDLDAALAALAAAHRQSALKDSLIERLLPDRAEQQRRLAGWNRFWNDHAGPFATDLAAACRELGVRDTAFAGSVARYRPQERGDELVPASWDGTPLQPLLGQLIQHDATGWRVAEPLDHLSDAETDRLAGRLDAAGGEVRVVSRRLMGKGLVDSVRVDLATRGLAMAAAMVLLIVVMERRLRRVVAILVPTALSLLWTFGLLGWIGSPLTPFTVLVGAFIAGIGIDSAVFLAQDDRRPSTLAPVLACAISTVIGMSSLLLANNPLLANVGLASVIGMGACLTACLLLTPGLSGGTVKKDTGVADHS